MPIRATKKNDEGFIALRVAPALRLQEGYSLKTNTASEHNKKKTIEKTEEIV